jgi:hypothetical protein
MLIPRLSAETIKNKMRKKVVRPEGLELSTFWFVD